MTDGRKPDNADEVPEEELRQTLLAEANRVLKPAIEGTAVRLASELGDLLDEDVDRAFSTVEPVDRANVEAVVAEAVRRLAAIWSNEDIRIVFRDRDFIVKGFGDSATH